MTQQLEEQEQKRNQLQEELSRKALFEQFLERVCDSTEYFEDIENILKRYETLEAVPLPPHSGIDASLRPPVPPADDRARATQSAQANHDLRSRMENAQNDAEDQSARRLVLPHPA